MLPKLTIRNKDICHITMESAVVSELKNASDDYVSVLKSITNVSIGLNTEGSYVIDCSDDNLDFLLNDLKQFNFKVAVIWAEGSWPSDADIDREILKSVKEWDKENWGCAGHIIDRPGRSDPYFHTQCVIVNLDTYKFLSKIKLYEYVTSTEHMHDDYTPKWIKPLSDGSLINAKPERSIFDQFLRTSIDQGLTIFNLDYNIRSNKQCCYPEDDIEFTENELFKKYTDPKVIYDIRENYPDKRELLGFKIQEFTNLYVTNTETVPHTDVTDIQVVVCPCSGLHQFKYIENSIDNMEMMVWTDFNPHAVHWLEILISEWDGRDFTEFFERNKHRLDFKGYFIHGHGTWEKFLDSFDNEEQWLTLWRKVQNLEHQFEVVNIVEEHDTIVNMLPHNKVVLLQCSNIWNYEANYFSKGLDTTLNGIKYITKVQSISDKVYFNGNMNGSYYDMTNIGRLKWI